MWQLRHSLISITLLIGVLSWRHWYLLNIVVGMEYVTLGKILELSLLCAYLIDICAGLAWPSIAGDSG